MIAEAMVRSVSEIPHAWSTVEVDVTGLVALRAQIRGDFELREGVELTYLPFVVKAVVESLKEHPTLNASWGGDKIILKKRINLGIAVAAPDGADSAGSPRRRPHEHFRTGQRGPGPHAAGAAAPANSG